MDVGMLPQLLPSWSHVGQVSKKHLRPHIYWGPVSDLRGEGDCFFQESRTWTVQTSRSHSQDMPNAEKNGSKAPLWEPPLQGRLALLGFLDPSLTPKGWASPGGGFQDGNIWGIKNRCNNGAGVCLTFSVWRQECPSPTKTRQSPMLITPYWETPIFWNCGIIFFPREKFYTEAQDIEPIK